MTAIFPFDAPAGTGRTDLSVSEICEPSRFAAYADGCGPAPVGGVERLLALIERVLTPGLAARPSGSGVPAP